MDQSPKKFSGEVREIGKDDDSWEDQHNENNKEEVEDTTVALLQIIKRDVGIDLTDKNVKALEVGSGSGTFLDCLRKHGVNAVGLDARARGSTQISARIEQLPFADETFDVIFSENVFDNSVYDQDQELMLKELARVLKHGGVYSSGLESRLRRVPFPGNLKPISPNSWLLRKI